MKSDSTPKYKPNKSICYIGVMGHHYREAIFRLMSRDLNCHFYFGDMKTSVKQIDYDSLPGFKGKMCFKKIYGNFHYLSGVLKIIKDYDYIFFLGDPHGVHTWISLIYAKLTNKKTFLWTHGWYGKENKVKSLIKKIFFGLSTKVLTYGNYARFLMIKEGISQNKIHTIYNSLNYDQQVLIRENFKNSNVYEHHFKNNYPVLIYIGRIQKIKRIDILIELASIMKNKENPVNVVLIGSNVDDDSISQLIHQHGLEENVWLYGPTYNEEEVCELVSSASICISPGNVGLTAMHALAYGCPVITHDDFSNQMPEFEAIIPGKNGDFFKHNDITDLERVVSNWIKKINTEREIIRKYCYDEITLHWNPEAQIKILKELINQNY